jgi:hypothetical protein
MGYGYYPFKKDKRLVKYINQLGYFYKDLAWNTYKPYGNILFWSGMTYAIYSAAVQEHVSHYTFNYYLVIVVDSPASFLPMQL